MYCNNEIFIMETWYYLSSASKMNRQYSGQNVIPMISMQVVIKNLKLTSRSISTRRVKDIWIVYSAV